MPSVDVRVAILGDGMDWCSTASRAAHLRALRDDWVERVDDLAKRLTLTRRGWRAR